ncbi:ATP-binding protein [Maribacter sp. 2210JD10-5]|uniref:ATP-binding protein n=1 Tax=Maribacter sp. 2210JD10-5 TaxID=3386272 RepID=UPI0039BC4B7E
MSKDTSHKLRYAIFILTVVVTIILNNIIVQHNIDLQLSDAKVINMAGRQRMLSQRIAKEILLKDGLSGDESKDELKVLVSEWENTHNLLKSGDAGIENTTQVDSLFQQLEPYYSQILQASETTLKAIETYPSGKAKEYVLNSESHFLKIMDQIVMEYQKSAETKLKKTKNIVLLLSCISILVLLGEFIFIILPFFNRLNEKNRDLAQSNARLSDFAHITSHNLLGPISNLNSLLHIYKIVPEEEKEEVMDKFKKVTDELNLTMTTMVETLRTQNNNHKKILPIVLDKVLSKTKKLMASELEHNHARIKTDFELHTITFNRFYMENIFKNLISNSIKFKAPDRAPEIHIRSMKIKNRPTLIFKDNGLGIDMERQGHKLFGLFKTFHRNKNARGIGLFMVRTQIEALGGTISATSKVNEGTTFTITF